MSDAKLEKEVRALMQIAANSKDPSSLWHIAANLEKLSAWTEAREVERMADRLERERNEVLAWRTR